MSLQFIENDKIDAAQRKLIRSHVMKGKNAGKTRKPRVQTQGPELEEDVAGVGKLNVRQPPMINKCTGNEVISIPKSLGDDLSYFSFPCTAEPWMMNRISQFMHINMAKMYPKEFCLPVDPMRTAWFEYLQMSEAFFHCCLVLATLEIDEAFGKRPGSPQALRHLANTYRSINEDLSSNGQPSDATLAVVVSLAVHENLIKHFGVSRMHLEALKRMVELRGGIEDISCSCYLWQKICRTDISYALNKCSHTLFYRHRPPHESFQPTRGRPRLMEGTSGPKGLSTSRDPDALCIMVDILDFSSVLNDEPSHFRLQPRVFQNTLISFSYRLLVLYPLPTDGPENKLEKLLHLGLLGLLVQLLFDYGRVGRNTSVLLADRFRKALKYVFDDDTTANADLMLYVLFLGGVTLFRSAALEWLYPRIRSCAGILRVRSWQEYKDILHQYPWINSLHDKAGEELWQAVSGT